MKIKPVEREGGVVVKLGRQEAQLPSPGMSEATKPMQEFHLQKILVPVDFSDCSKKALQYAVPFARQFGSELTLLYVIEPPPLPPEMSPVEVESVQSAREYLEGLKADVCEGVSTSVVVHRGEPYVEIIAAATELGTDLIILSTHGRTGLAHVLMGSTAEKVTRHSRCPILIVREHERDFVVGNPGN